MSVYFGYQNFAKKHNVADLSYGFPPMFIAKKNHVLSVIISANRLRLANAAKPEIPKTQFGILPFGQMAVE
ncbi:hypothetical protein IH799_09295 [candidate division KSB1 bacterium]|nr:hypothetical protein [candidate division KSB1 bacterium]